MSGRSCNAEYNGAARAARGGAIRCNAENTLEHALAGEHFNSFYMRTWTYEYSCQCNARRNVAHEMGSIGCAYADKD
jgi:hypothetical protein